MNDDFDKKLDIIFKRIEFIISANKKNNNLKNIQTIISLITTLLALIISFETLIIYRNTYDITKDSFY